MPRGKARQPLSNAPSAAIYCLASRSQDLFSGRVSNVIHGIRRQLGLRAKRVITGGLVLPRPPIQLALLIIAQRAHRVGNVEQHVVLPDPAVRILQAARDEIHAVGRAQRQPVRVDEVPAVGRVGVLVGHGDAAARDRLLGGGLARLQVVPRVVADVVGAAGLVDAQEVHGAVAEAELDADVVAVDAHGPVGHAVGVDLAPQDADRGRVAVVGGRPDARPVCRGEGDEGGEAQGQAEECVVYHGRRVD